MHIGQYRVYTGYNINGFTHYDAFTYVLYVCHGFVIAYPDHAGPPPPPTVGAVFGTRPVPAGVPKPPGTPWKSSKC